MRTILSCICLFMATLAAAQRECATSQYLQEQLKLHPGLSRKEGELEDFVRQRLAERPSTLPGKGEGPVSIIRIPVVVHILFSTDAQNIPDERVHSQIAALNRDFRRQNGDSTKTPQRFKSLAADTGIEFYLATADPEGRPTTGINRKKSSNRYWKMDDAVKFSGKGGIDAWDSRSYLNIWVADMRTLLGYGSFPGGPANLDGIVLNFSGFGTIGSAAPYHLGRTAVHEVGHWLGLRHIWGDDYCGNDGVDDTPTQSGFTGVLPKQDEVRISCGNAPQGDMYMNYMDFTPDTHINLFTHGQKARMRALFLPGGPRYSLLASKGGNTPWNEPKPEVEPAPVPVTGFRSYPNPARESIRLDFTYDASWIGREVEIVSAEGQVVQRVRITALQQKLSIGNLKPGVYFIRGRGIGTILKQRFIKL